MHAVSTSSSAMQHLLCRQKIAGFFAPTCSPFEPQSPSSCHLLWPSCLLEVTSKLTLSLDRVILKNRWQVGTTFSAFNIHWLRSKGQGRVDIFPALHNLLQGASCMAQPWKTVPHVYIARDLCPGRLHHPLSVFGCDLASAGFLLGKLI